MGLLSRLLGLGRRAVPEIEDIARMTPPPREIASNGMTIRPSEPFRTSLVGGSDDLAEAASFGQLPMDEASRMARAREMGFDMDAPLYHGTDQNIEAFRTNDGWYGNGVYATRSPQQAEYYTRRTPHQTATTQRVAGEGWQEPAPNIMPLVARGRLASVEEYQTLVRENMPRGKWTKAGEDNAVRRAQQELERRGYAGVDAGGIDDEVVIFNPSNVRSRFAAFNPARSGEANLLAGTAIAAPVVGGGLLSRARERRNAGA